VLSARDQFIEDFGLFFEKYGLSRIMGRIYGLLLISDAHHLSLEQIARELNISRASASTVARQLEAMTLLQKSTVPGDRRDYYRVAEDSHIRTVRLKLNSALSFSSLIQKGAQLEGIAPTTRQRLKRMEHFYNEIAEVINAFFQNYRAPEEVEA
jgi:DNA-binding transcriptional regulator GbsR (MarR family)